MRVACKKCAYILESLILKQDEALKDLANKSTRHIAKEHKTDMEQMQKAVAIVMPALLEVMHFQEFMFVPEAETFLLEKLGKERDIVMAALGYDPSEDDEDEEDEEETEDDGVTELDPEPDLSEEPELETKEIS